MLQPAVLLDSSVEQNSTSSSILVTVFRLGAVRHFPFISLRLDSAVLYLISSMKDTVAPQFWIEQVLVRLQLAAVPRTLAMKALTVSYERVEGSQQPTRLQLVGGRRGA